MSSPVRVGTSASITSKITPVLFLFIRGIAQNLHVCLAADEQHRDGTRKRARREKSIRMNYSARRGRDILTKERARIRKTAVLIFLFSRRIDWKRLIFVVSFLTRAVYSTTKFESVRALLKALAILESFDCFRSSRSFKNGDRLERSWKTLRWSLSQRDELMWNYKILKEIREIRVIEIWSKTIKTLNNRKFESCLKRLYHCMCNKFEVTQSV